MNLANQPAQPSPDPDGDNPLEFWVAYLPAAGEKKNYLSDGKGNLRLFKSESALREWLKPQMRPEVYEMVVVHSLQGQIALPDDGTFVDSTPNLEYTSGITPMDIQNLTPIRTTAIPDVPTAQEQLDNLIERRRRRQN